MNGEEMLRVTQVARELGLDPRTVRGWCKSGRLPARKIGGQWRIPRSWLEMWIEAETAQAVVSANG